MTGFNKRGAKHHVLELMLTEECNLSCVYCYEKNKNTARMSIEMAKAAICAAFDRPGFEDVEIQFFGGEPLIAFERIREICDWLWKRSWPKPYICFATTNGTLVHGEIKEWMIQNSKRFVLGLSLDGTPEMHDTNRSGSFSRIDLDFFKSVWPSQSAKMTVSPLTLPTLFDGITYLHRLGIPFTCNLAYGVDWKERHYEIFAAELRKIADFYIDHPDILPCNIAVMQIAHALSSEKNSRWCGAGTAMRCVHMSGVTYPCQMFMPSSAGKDINIQAIFESLKENQPTEDNGCKGCKLLSICATCYGNNFVESGSIVTRNVHRCRFEQIRAKAAAYLLANMVVHSERGYIYMRNRSDAYVQTLIQSIKYINNNYLLSKETSS